MMRFSRFIPTRIAAALSLAALGVVGCSSAPTGLSDAATEEAIKADMAKVASAEQENNRKNPVVSTAPANPGVEFHPDEQARAMQDNR